MADDIDLDAILAHAQAFDKKRTSSKPVIVDKPAKKVKVSEEVCFHASVMICEPMLCALVACDSIFHVIVFGPS
jgi:hypothetical protein